MKKQITTLKDEIGRKVLILKNEKIFYTRHPDMTEKTKCIIIDIVCQISDIDKKEISDFLNYKDDKISFCS